MPLKQMRVPNEETDSLSITMIRKLPVNSSKLKSAPETKLNSKLPVH